MKAYMIWNSQAKASAVVIANRQREGKLDGLRGLRGCRERAGVTQGEAAMRIGVPRVSYQQWEACRYWPGGGSCRRSPARWAPASRSSSSARRIRMRKEEISFEENKKPRTDCNGAGS